MSAPKVFVKILEAYEATFPRQHGFYRSVCCSQCCATAGDHDASKILHKLGCIVGRAREMASTPEGGK